MNHTTDDEKMHLTPEAVERIGMGGEPGADEARHLASCNRCRHEVAELGSLQVRLAALVLLAPASGFADRIMARVRLPTPLWVRALDGVRAHRLRAAAVAATLVAAVAGTLSWLTAYPQLTPGAMTNLLWERGSGLLWQGVLSIGRVVYDSGLFALLQAFRADLNAWSAVGALATLALVGSASLWMLMRLMDLSPKTIRWGPGRIV
jgi:hypothetical protein